MRRWLALIAVGLLLMPVTAETVLAEEAPIRVAAERRTLFDLLFGPKKETPPPAANTQRSTTKRSSPSVQALPPPVPKVDKTDGATRLAVFGDSLAVDLAKALDRFYAEDPNLAIIGQGVGSSGFVRDDFFDWPEALGTAIAQDSFDLAVVIIGINDRQSLRVDGKNAKPLTDVWRTAYAARINGFLQDLRAAGKPAVWVELPIMQKSSYSAAMAEISAIHRLAAFANGAEFVETYERFADEDGDYSSYGPDLNGQRIQTRKGDGIHFSSRGADKLAFYVNQAVRTFYRGGSVSLEIAVALTGTDAANLQRPPFQGLGQIRLLEVAGAVLSLDLPPVRAQEMVVNTVLEMPEPLDLAQLVKAPVGRADAFGAGVLPVAPEDDTPPASADGPADKL